MQARAGMACVGVAAALKHVYIYILYTSLRAFRTCVRVCVCVCVCGWVRAPVLACPCPCPACVCRSTGMLVFVLFVFVFGLHLYYRGSTVRGVLPLYFSSPSSLPNTHRLKSPVEST